MSSSLRITISIFFLSVCSVFGQDVNYSYDEIDVFPRMDKYSCNEQKERKRCFESMLQSYFKDNFESDGNQYSPNDELNAYTQFVVTKTGKVENIKIRSQNENFKMLTETILRNLSFSTPALKNGEAVDFIFTMPFYYKYVSVKTISYEFPESLDSVPVFPGCESENDHRACFKITLQELVRRNFVYPQEAIKNKVQGIVISTITIDKNGTVSNIETSSPDPLLTKQVLLILKKLPEFTPATKDGQAVDTSISFPITFALR